MTKPIEAWPSGGLEQVENCPVCGAGARVLLHAELTDRVFFVAPGKWTMWQCSNCCSAYLDPRPNEASIGLAYRQYYTHEKPDHPAPQSSFQRWRASLANNYRNFRYGTRLTTTSRLGGFATTLFKPLAGSIDVAFRYLPQPAPGRPRNLLDVGCGSGAFLDTARSAGWSAAGAEPDPISRKRAQDSGFDVRESVGAWRNEATRFDYVTLSHVIEHVHNPIELLADCLALLKPGGGLFIDTPNIDALGHLLYGRNWLHLDPPRHLTLFNRSSLADSVSRTGFERLCYHRRPYAFRNSAEASRHIAAGLDPFSHVAGPEIPPPPGLLVRAKGMLDRQRDEFLTLTASKPCE